MALLLGGGQLSQAAPVGILPEMACFVPHYRRLIGMMTSLSSKNIVYLKLMPDIPTETRLVICAGIGVCSGQKALWRK